MRRIGGDREKDRATMLVRLGSEEQRREILMKKSNLRGRRKRIMKDWTWKERRMLEIGGDSEEGGELREESEDRMREDKDWESMVEMGRRGGEC